MDENLIRLLRAQAWERAKGELNAVLEAFFGESSSRPGQHAELEELITEFIKLVEDKGLAE